MSDLWFHCKDGKKESRAWLGPRALQKVELPLGSYYLSQKNASDRMLVVTSKQHISAFRASILKNLVSFGKIFQFPAIRVLLEVASSNSLEVMSQ